MVGLVQVISSRQTRSLTRCQPQEGWAIPSIDHETNIVPWKQRSDDSYGERRSIIPYNPHPSGPKPNSDPSPPPPFLRSFWVKFTFSFFLAADERGGGSPSRTPLPLRFLFKYLSVFSLIHVERGGVEHSALSLSLSLGILCRHSPSSPFSVHLVHPL